MSHNLEAVIRRSVLLELADIYHAAERFEEAELIRNWFADNDGQQPQQPATTTATSSSPQQPQQPATTTATSSSPQAGELDSAGTPFNPELHTGTKTPTGKWRRKRGVDASAESGSILEPGNQPGIGLTDFLAEIGRADLTQMGFGNWLRDRFGIESINIANHPDKFDAILAALREEGYLE